MDSQNTLKEILSGNYINFPTHPWFYFFILKFFTIFGTSELIIRIPSVLAGISLIWAFYTVAKFLTGQTKTALLGSFILASSAYHSFQSVHAKENELLLLIQLLSLLFYLYYLKYKHIKYLITHLSLLYLSTITSFYTIWFVSLLFFINTYMSVKKKLDNKKLKIIMAGYISIILLLSPLILLLLQNKTRFFSVLNWIPKPSISQLTETLNLYLGFKPIFSYGFMIIVVFLILLIVSNKITYFLKYLLLFWFWFPLIAAYLFSILFKPIFIDHYLLLSSLAIYFILAIVSHYYKWAFILIVLTVIVNIRNNTYELTNPTGENWREAFNEIFFKQKISKENYLITDDFAAYNYYVNYRIKPENLPKTIFLRWEDSFKKEKSISYVSTLINKGNKVCIATTFISYEDVKHVTSHITEKTDIYPQVLCLMK